MEYIRDLPGVPLTTLNHGDALVSATRSFKLIFQADGNLVLYAIDDASLPAHIHLATLNMDIIRARYSRVIWASYTNGSGAVRCVMQNDGNLVLYSASRAVWASQTNGHPGALLRCQDDGNLVILDGVAPIWASNTNARPMGDSMGHRYPPDGLISGYSVQLNAYSQTPADTASAAQQYIIAVGDGHLTGLAQVWSANEAESTPDIAVDLGPWRVAAGTRFHIELGNDAEGNVTRATFQVFDEHGLVTSGFINVAEIPKLQALAPIAAFQVNIVGPINGESVIFSSGAGMITYSSANELTPLAALPAWAEAQGGSTVESGNTAYGTLLAKASTTFTQSFQISAQTPT